MTQDDYKLWTGETVNYTQADWTRLVNSAAERLASFLCLPALPTDEEGNYTDPVQELLANFMSGVFHNAGTKQEVASKHIRNYTISFRSQEAANAFAKIAENYADVIAGLSACTPAGFIVEDSARDCCGRL